MSVPAGGEGIAKASGEIEIITTQAEKAPAKMESVAKGITNALAPLDQATKKVQESIRLTAIEAQKGVNDAKATQSQITAIVRGDTNERLIIARTEGAERSQYARALTGELLETLRQETNQKRAQHQTSEREARASFTKETQISRQGHQAQMQEGRQFFQASQQTQRQSFTKQQQDTRQFFQANQQTQRQGHQVQMQDSRQFFQANQQNSRQSFTKQQQDTRQIFQAGQQQLRQSHQATQQLNRQSFQTQTKLQSQFYQASSQTARQFFQSQQLQQRQAGQTQAQQHQATLQAQTQANRVFNQQQAQQNRIQLLQMRQQGGGGGGGILGSILGGLGGAAGGIGGQIFQTLGAVATLDLGNIISEVIQLGVQITKAGIEAAVAGEKIATSFQRQSVAGAQMTGSYSELAAVMAVYTKAAGGAVSQTDALSEVIRLNALGFANSKEQVRNFVTAARGISVAMGRGIQDVVSDLALAIGNMSTRRLDQLGLSVTEVNKRILELRTTQQGMSRQEAFEQAVIGLSTEKFGELARSTEAQSTAVEQLAADWSDLGLAMGQLVKPKVDAVAKSLDDVTRAAIAAAKAARLEELRTMKVPATPGGFELGGVPVEQTAGQLFTRSAALKGEITMYRRMLKDGDGDAENIRRNLEEAANELAKINVSLAPARIAIALQTKDFPQGAPDIQGGTKPRSAFDRVTEENPEIMTDWVKRNNEIAQKAMQDSFEEQEAYDDRVAKSERQFHEQLAEQAEDYQRKRARDEESFQDDLARMARESNERDVKARRDFDQQVAKEKRDNGRQQQKWERDLNQSIAKNNKDEKEAEGKADDDLAEKNLKDTEDNAKKLKDIEEKYQDDRKKAIKDHNESLADAAAHLDAAAVYEEQRRFARETKDAAEAHDKSVAEEKQNLDDRQKENQKSHDDAISELQKNNADRNKEEKESYDQRVSDANEALDQQIADQTDALNQQLEDARTADNQRLEDMKTAHDNQKTQEETDYGLQLDRQKTHHDNELTELNNQHTARMTQIGEQAQDERDQNQIEFEARLAEAGLASVKYVKAEQAFHDSSLAITQKWWQDQLGITKGITPVLGSITPEAQAQIDFLATEYGDLIDRLNKAQDPADIKSLNSSIDMVYEALSLLDPVNYPRGGRAGASSISGASWSNLDTGASGNAAVMGAGGIGTSTVTMGDVTIVLGDIGSRSNQDVKNMIGEALVEWVEAAALQPGRSRW